MISIPATVKISLRALWVNKMRSSLTMLGIIIGVGAVIAMLAVGTGASRKIAQQVDSVGSNLIVVVPGSMTQGGLRMGLGSQSTLNTSDANAIESECSAVQTVAPILNGSGQVIYGNQNWATSITGTTPNILVVRDCAIVEGRNFSDQDIRNATKVCLIGHTIIENLFENEDPVGKIIRVKNVPFTVIGVLEEKGQSLGGQDQDDVVYIPITTAQKKIIGTAFPGMVRAIMVKAKSTDELPIAETEVNDLLMQRHHIGPSRDVDFTVRNLTQMLQMAQQFTLVMTLLLGAIASVSLVVGGIGIMNIMLVSVTERTREIGIRMAVGAKAKDIRFQFIIEAVTLSLIGGIVGIIVGVIVAASISKFADWPTVVSPFAVLLAFGFSGFIGIFFGFYPAYKASLLNPIDALRYE